MEGTDDKIDFCKKLELYIQTDYYKSQIAMGAFSTRFDKFLNENKVEEIVIKKRNESNLNFPEKCPKCNDTGYYYDNVAKYRCNH